MNINIIFVLLNLFIFVTFLVYLCTVIIGIYKINFIAVITADPLYRCGHSISFKKSSVESSVTVISILLQFKTTFKCFYL